MKQENLEDYDKDFKIKIQNSPIFRTNPEVKQIVIVNRMIITDSLNYVPNKLKYTRLRYSLLRWPNPFSANLRVTLNLEKIGLPDDFIYFSNINREGTIDKLLLPPCSYYTSGGEFERDYLGKMFYCPKIIG